MFLQIPQNPLELFCFCKLGTSQFADPGPWISPVAVGTNHPPFPCQYCGKFFQTKSGRQKHLRFHTGETLDCTICGNICQSNAHLKSHMEAVHENVKFSCERCGKLFSYLCSLQLHLRRNTCSGKDVHP